MVASNYYQQGLDLRWVAYLALSVCINLMIIAAIKFDTPIQLIPELARIKINLKAPPITKQRAVSLPQPETANVVPQSLKNRVDIDTNAKQHVSVQKQEVVKATDVQLTEKLDKFIEGPVVTEAVSESTTDTVETLNDSIVSEVKESTPAPNALVADATEVTEANAESKKLAAEAVNTVNEASDSVIYDARYRQKTPPLYPQRAVELGQQGNVMLHAKIMPSGLPEEIKIVESSGHRLLDKAALAAVRTWVFEPTNINGNAIVSWVRVPVIFVIQ
jgi:periplasmic protein TonB